MTDLTVLSAADAWAVGAGGSLARWDGISWRPVPSPVQENLRAVAFLSPGDGWAVGDDLAILHWDGTAWLAFDPPEIPGEFLADEIRLLDVVFSAPDNGWIAGSMEGKDGAESGLILHWDGLTWQREKIVPNTGCLCSLSVDSGKGVWVVGVKPAGADASFSSPVLHWSGERWDVPGEIAGVKGTYSAVRSSAAGDIWISGNELIREGSSPLGWFEQGFLLHWNGTVWQKIDFPSGWKNKITFSMAVRSPTDILLGGNIAARWNGARWSEVAVPIRDNLILDLEVLPDGSVWALTQKGIIYQLEVLP